jgi:hypothetical protein
VSFGALGSRNGFALELLEDDDAGMIELRFIAGSLVQRERELARVGIDASIVADGRKYGIVRTKTRGWHYAVKDRETGRHVCDFDPLLVRRGGSLRSDGSTLQMRGRALRPRSWSFADQSGQRIEVSSRSSRGDPFRFVLLLRSENSLMQAPNTPVVLALALGCWLIVSWERAQIMPIPAPPTGPWGLGC